MLFLKKIKSSNRKAAPPISAYSNVTRYGFNVVPKVIVSPKLQGYVGFLLHYFSELVLPREILSN